MRAARWLLVAALAVSGALHAQDDPCKEIEKKSGGETLLMLQRLYFAECLGGDKDRDAVAKATLPLVAAHRIDDALRQVFDYVDAAAPARQAGSQALLASLSREVQEVRRRLAAAQPLGDQDAIGWQWRNTGFSGLPAVNPAVLDVKCKEATQAPCVEAAATGKIVFRSAHLVEQALRARLSDAYEEALAAANTRKAKWDRYFDEARVQFPWELYANGLRYGAENRRQGGFAEPPNDQLILLHPGVGMEYIRGAPSGSRLQAALLVELIGYNRWSWTSDGRMQRAFGASIIQTYSDRAGLASARPGVMLTFANKYSVAVTSRDGKTGVLLSVDLAKLVTKTEEDERQAFKLLGRPAP